MKTISLTIEEMQLLQELVDEAISETSPTPTNTMKSLATKIELSELTKKWIERMLNK